MAHFAQLDENNIVTNVIVVDNSITHSHTIPNGDESEERGIAFCKQIFGEDTRWVQTSYNANFRRYYAHIGFSYNAELDAFIPPCPTVGYILNTETLQWEAPIPMPTDGNKYYWTGTEWLVDNTPSLERTPVAFLNPITGERGPNYPE